jgi:hypothetical protein
VDVVDAGVPHEGDVPEEVAANKRIVPIKLILYQVNQSVVLTVLNYKVPIVAEPMPELQEPASFW